MRFVPDKYVAIGGITAEKPTVTHSGCWKAISPQSSSVAASTRVQHRECMERPISARKVARLGRVVNYCNGARKTSRWLGMDRKTSLPRREIV
jgi:hypothetical protein